MTILRAPNGWGLSAMIDRHRPPHYAPLIVQFTP